MDWHPCNGCESCLYVSELRMEYGVLVKVDVPYCIIKRVYVSDRRGPCERGRRLESTANEMSSEDVRTVIE